MFISHVHVHVLNIGYMHVAENVIMAIGRKQGCMDIYDNWGLGDSEPNCIFQLCKCKDCNFGYFVNRIYANPDSIPSNPK